MITFLVILLIIWAAAAIVGFVVKGLLWLGFVGLILFVITALWLYFRGKRKEREAARD
ncbi:hypothetical protein [Scrofimicrobium canadense]|uniref:hypothetical protein n=1 Tax=Scrofimicrobium canadense TaxID=2652290 RepID=UPI00197D8B59|nr:hypothetical protein [Scrofimicrobium canadense]